MRLLMLAVEVVDFLFVLIELFLLGVTAEAAALRVNAPIDRKSAFLKGLGQFRPYFYVGKDVPMKLFALIVTAVNALQLCR